MDGVLRDNAWKLRGIVNGMDYQEWSPDRDVFLNSDGYRHYTLQTVREGKAACKAALQRVGRLPSNLDTSCLTGVCSIGSHTHRLQYRNGSSGTNSQSWTHLVLGT